MTCPTFLPDPNGLDPERSSEGGARALKAQQAAILASLEEGVVVRDREGRIVDSNAAAARILGREPWLADCPCETGQDLIREDGSPFPGDDLPLRRVVREGKPVPATLIGFRREDGSRAWVLMGSRPVFDQGSFAGTVCTFSDVTQQQVTAEALALSERQVRGFLDTLPDPMFRLNARGVFLEYRGPSTFRTEVPPEAFLGRSLGEVLPDIAGPARIAIRRCLEEGCPQSLSYQLSGPAGAARHFEARLIPYREDEVLAIVRDISDFKRQAADIQGALQEKELLLREIHHRVKNNLQVVSSLLRLQAASHAHPEVQRVLHEAQERIQAIALIHQRLKVAPDASQLDLPTYVRTLAERLVRSHASAPALVDLQLSVDPVRIGSDEAVPLGLILNELISNALRHAFPPGEGGSLDVEIAALPDGQAMLRVADSGTGLPEGVDLEHGGLGFQLVQALTDQLRGTLELERRRGAAFRLTFTPRPDQDSHGA